MTKAFWVLIGLAICAIAIIHDYPDIVDSVLPPKDEPSGITIFGTSGMSIYGKTIYGGWSIRSSGDTIYLIKEEP